MMFGESRPDKHGRVLLAPFKNDLSVQCTLRYTGTINYFSQDNINTRLCTSRHPVRLPDPAEKFIFISTLAG